MTDAQLLTSVAQMVNDSNLRLFQEMDRAQKVLVMEEPRGPSQLIEVPVTAAGLGKVVFPDIQNLRSQVGQVIIIKAMRLITDPVLTFASTGGQQTAPLTELQKICLVIYCEGWEKGQLIPILTLNDMYAEASNIPFRKEKMRFNNWKNVDWSKTFLQYSNGQPSVLPGGNPYSVMLDVEYVKLDAQNQEIIGPS